MWRAVRPFRGVSWWDVKVFDVAQMGRWLFLPIYWYGYTDEGRTHTVRACSLGDSLGARCGR